MSTPWILGIVNDNKKVSAIAVRHDGYLEDIKQIIKNLSADNVREIVDCPLVEISGICDKGDVEDSIKNYPKLNNWNDYKNITGTNYYMHLPHDYGDKNKRNLWTWADFVNQDVSDNKIFKNVLDFEKNAERLECWYSLVLLEDDKWKFKEFKDKEFKTLEGIFKDKILETNNHDDRNAIAAEVGKDSKANIHREGR